MPAPGAIHPREIGLLHLAAARGERDRFQPREIDGRNAVVVIHETGGFFSDYRKPVTADFRT